MSGAGIIPEELASLDTEGVAAFLEGLDIEEFNGLLSDTFGAAFTLLSAAHQAERDASPLDLTISHVGRCVRQAAFRLAGVTASDEPAPGERRVQTMGTIVHRALLPVLAGLLGGQAEVPVKLTAGSDELTGTADLVVGRRLIELKSAREAGMVTVIGSGARDAARVQAVLYAVALIQAGAEIDTVTWAYLDRATGREHLITEPVTLKLQHWALRRLWDVQAFRSRPDWAPRTERGPGLSSACDECRWLRRCWGADARPQVVGPQRRIARTIGDVERLLTQYAALGEQAREIKEEREFIKTAFTAGSRPGTYGDLRWYRTRDGQDVDAAEAERLLIENGIAVPYRPRSGQVRIGPAKRAE